MKFLKENNLLIIALLISILVHAAIFTLFSKIDKLKTTKKEEKPIIISFVNTKESSKYSSAKRKIPRKTKLNSPKKSTKPFSQKSNLNKKRIIRKKQTKRKVKNQKTVNKASKTVVKEKTINKKQSKQKETKKQVKEIPKPKISKKENIKEKIIKNPKVKQKIEVPIKKEGKKLQISSGKPEKEIKNVLKLSTPPAENNKAKKEKPPKQLNISHLKGKNEIFQMGNENKKETKAPKKDKDIMKYLYKVRDKLQENLAYPLMAKRLEIEGTVIVRFVINPDGTVDKKTIKVVKSSGSNILDKQATITVKNSIPFEPTPNKKKVVVEIPVIFEIIRSYN